MNLRPLVSAFFSLTLCALGREQQIPPPAPTTADFGFEYHVPAGWDPIDAQSTLPEVKARQTANAKTDEEKKEIACIQVPVSARKGPTPSFLAAMALPFDCFGQIMTEKDLPGFAEGASEGPRAFFDFAEPTFGSYKLGEHSMWIERAKGNPKGHPEMGYTLEVACSLLKRAAVCWMTVTGDDASLKQFEETAVTLDGDFNAELVPANAFEKKPGT